MTEKVPSLRRRLLVAITIPVLISGLLISLMSFLFSWHEIAEVYDAQMAHTAHVLIDLVEDDIKSGNAHLREDRNDSLEMQHRYERKTGYRLWHKDVLILESLRARDFGNFRAPEGFSNQELAGKPWRFFVHHDPERDITVEISQRYAIRYELINQLMLSLLIPAFIFLPVILTLIWLAAGKSLQPLMRLSADVDKRHSDDLTPITTDTVPKEALPLAHAMNRLLARIHDSFIREREFTDHAAHELRTPLAAMKTQTQVLLKKSSDNPQLKDGLENLGAAIERAAHLIDQLLSLARLQNERLPLARTNLSECLIDIVSDLDNVARSRNLSIDTDIASPVVVNGHADSLMILLRNFIDNAIKYTPAGGHIHVSLTPAGTLIIRDNGPGLTEEQKKAAFDRFVRFDKTGQTGSGLGLSIASWIAGAHRIPIHLEDSSPHGLTVRMEWKPV